MPTDTLPGYFTVSQAAIHLGVSHSQVTRYISSKRLPAIDLGHQKLIPARKVKSFKRAKPGRRGPEKG